jgi:hypothetical protein
MGDDTLLQCVWIQAVLVLVRFCIICVVAYTSVRAAIHRVPVLVFKVFEQELQVLRYQCLHQQRTILCTLALLHHVMFPGHIRSKTGISSGCPESIDLMCYMTTSTSNSVVS